MFELLEVLDIGHTFLAELLPANYLLIAGSLCLILRRRIENIEYCASEIVSHIRGSDRGAHTAGTAHIFLAWR